MSIKRLFAVCLASMLLALCSCQSQVLNNTYDNALERVQAYADAINHDYEKPEKIYAFLTQDMKTQITKSDFCTAWEKERTYPYITPLYIFYPALTISEDGMFADAVFKQAARIVGMEYTVHLVYENGDYYVEDWQRFADGSYLEKFEDTPYQLDWYYDVGGLEK